MRVFTARELRIDTPGRGFTHLTHDVSAVVSSAGVAAGLCSVFIRHTSASLILCENADPEVLADLERFAARLVVDGDPLFRHVAEGPDDMAAHVRSVLTRTDVTIPVQDGLLALGTWQGIYLWEHRARPHHRCIIISVFGDS